MKKLPGIVNKAGLIILLLIILLYLPLSVIRMSGCEAYSFTGSGMEPTVSAGSLIIVKRTDPASVATGTIITYIPASGGDAVTRRVVKNREQAFITTADANDGADPLIVPYGSLAGRMTVSLKGLGRLFSAAASTEGKFAAASFAAAGFILPFLPGLLDKRRGEKRGKERLNLIVFSVIPLCAAIFLLAFSPKVMPSGDASAAPSAPAAVTEAAEATPAPEVSPAAEAEPTPTAAPTPTPKPVPAVKPIEYTIPSYLDDGFTVDFEPLAELNPDTVGWIHFPKNPKEINYPVVKSADNEDYLTKTFSGNEYTPGAIFLDMNCDSSFSGSVSIIYGYAMSDGTMFGKLRNYSDRTYREANPGFYVLTPDGERHCCLVFSCFEADEESEVYKPENHSGEGYAKLLKLLKSSADYDTGIEVNEGNRIVILSTCMNAGGNDGYIVCAVMAS